MPTTPERTPEGKWTIYRTIDGQRYTRWPVDARAMLETGEYTADPPSPADAPAAPVAPGTESVPSPHLPPPARGKRK